MVLVDTGFWLALANRADRHHGAAKKAIASLSEPLLTTWPVLTETSHLLLNRLGAFSQLAFIKSIAAGGCEVFTLDRSHLARVSALMKKYEALPMDLADASLVIAAEECNEQRILSTDVRDFRSYRWKERKPFQNLLEI